MPRLKFTPAEVQQVLHQLAETPVRLAACAAGKSEHELRSPPEPKGWAAVEILAHLRACNELWSHSIYAMLASDNPELPDLDERRWAKTRRYASLDFHDCLQAFTLSRQELLHVLRALPAEAWGRTGLIAGRTHSVFSQSRRLAKHESEHCAQMEGVFENRD
jgi:hypothetical protein